MQQRFPALENPLTLDEERSKSLAALTLAAAQKLASDTLLVDAGDRSRKARMARVSDLAILDQPADETAPRCINVYFVENNGERFKFGPDRLLYALHWLHKGEPPDLDLTLAPPFACAPEVWFNHAASLLMGALQEVSHMTHSRAGCKKGHAAA